MSNSLAEELFQQLQGAPLQQLSQQLGTGQAETSNAIGTALPLLLGASAAMPHSRRVPTHCSGHCRTITTPASTSAACSARCLAARRRDRRTAPRSSATSSAATRNVQPQAWDRLQAWLPHTSGIAGDAGAQLVN